MALSYRMWNVKNNDRIITVINKAANFGRETPTTTMHSLWWGKDGGDSKRPIGLIAALITHLQCVEKVEGLYIYNRQFKHLLNMSKIHTYSICLDKKSRGWLIRLCNCISAILWITEKLLQVLEHVLCLFHDAYPIFNNIRCLRPIDCDQFEHYHWIKPQTRIKTFFGIWIE